MRKNFVIALIIFSAAIILLGGCSDRKERVPTASTDGSNWGGWPNVDWAFRTSSGSAAAPPQFLFQLRNPDAVLQVDFFIPNEAWPAPRGEGQRVPYLVLLAPEGENHNFYRDRGLYQLASEMIADGEIDPMIIASIGNDPTFDGYFYGNSYAAGQYDAIIADTALYYDSDFGVNMARGLISYIESEGTGLGTLIKTGSADQRGIGGVGQGAYGAFRAILKHPGVFNSISVADGPLSFADGIPALVPAAMAEQQARWTARGLAGTFNDINLFDTLSTMPLSRMFVGGALAFSPNDTLVTYSFINQTNPANPDPVVINSRTYWTDPSNPDTSSTFVTTLIKQVDGDWDFHLPFDASGTMNAVVWQRWMDNDLSTLLTDAGAGALDDVNIWIGTSNQAKWYYDEMTEAWISTLGTNVDEVYRYHGYSGNPATDNEYVYDLMKKMLKFHSDNFGTD